MNELNLSAGKGSDLNISGNAPYKHNRLGGLDFDSSGHTGFQKELSPEQIEKIEAVPGKEDKENKVTALTEESNDVHYPSAKAVMDGIQNKTGWELVASDTLSEDVGTLTVNFNKKYKELYVHTIITTANPEADASFPTGRVAVYVGKNYTKQVFMEQNPLYKDNGVSYPLNFNIKLFGEACRIHRHYASTTANSQYTNSASLYSGYTDIGQNYIDMVTLYFLPATRKFPAGTYYEIWGVRA